MEDKMTEWDVAIADLNGKQRHLNIARAVVGLTCTATYFSLGIAGPACAGAVAAQAYGTVERDTAAEKADAAADAALQAIAHYGTCLAKTNKSSEQ
jgi:hypothetical protein